jgi:AcrR family transcriptional regulator
MPIDGDSTQTSRARLLAAGKQLFGRLGYEQTSTATIARESGSSESQLIRYFGGKAGLLEAIFNESWGGLTEAIGQGVAAAANGREAILNVLGLFVEAFSRDHDVAFLFMFEGRRIRGNEVVLSKGFLQFFELICSLVRRAQEDGSFRSGISDAVVASALLGAAEGMMRDRMIADRTGGPNPFDDAVIRKAFETVVGGFAA